jgi:hypothetical protein
LAAKRKRFSEGPDQPPNPIPDGFRERKGNHMKIANLSKGLLVSLAVLLATSAFAANKGSLQISDTVTLAGKRLAPGTYTVKWEGNGPSVQANIMQGKNVVATVPARLVDLDRAPGHDAAVTRRGEDGSKSVDEIRFYGKKQALAFNEQTAKAESSEGGK